MMFLVLGGTGTVGSRVAAQLRSAGHDVRIAARHADCRFDWSDPTTWPAALRGVHSMYVLLPEQTALPAPFLPAARQAGVRRVVLHSDRGVEVMRVANLQDAERQVRDSGLEWTIVRPDWFNQNFGTFFRQAVLDGRLCVPVTTRQGFVDADDIAAVGVAALTSSGHAGRVLELTGPRALSFPEALAHIADASGRTVEFDPAPAAFRESMRAGGLPDELVEAMLANYAALTARGDTAPTGAVEAVLGRPGKDFADYARETAAEGVWVTSAGG
jgi:uncharacterized protein YbjT (DUF2867 family)